MRTRILTGSAAFVAAALIVLAACETVDVVDTKYLGPDAAATDVTVSPDGGAEGGEADAQPTPRCDLDAGFLAPTPLNAVNSSDDETTAAESPNGLNVYVSRVVYNDAGRSIPSATFSGSTGRHSTVRLALRRRSARHSTRQIPSTSACK